MMALVQPTHNGLRAWRTLAPCGFDHGKMRGSNKTTAVCCSGWNNEQLANDGCFQGNRTTIKIDFSWTLLREDKDSPKNIHRKSGKWRPQDDLVWSFLFIWEVLQIGVAQKPVGFPKKTKTTRMITWAATWGWDVVDGCYCSLDTAQGIL